MARIPTRFKRITATFDDDARARLCRSSGSEHSASNSLTDLSDLVDSFIEGDGGDLTLGVEDTAMEEPEYQETESFYGTDSETKEMLMDLIGDCDEDDEDDREKLAIRSTVETLCLNLETCSSEGFKRHLMTLLRRRGFDAGLCKCRWEKTGRHPAGEYEYIDVLISGKRYIVEVSLRSQFTIARQTKTYQSLVEIIPQITVIEPNTLKKVVRLMCAEMRASLKTRNMVVSPWRKNGYMQAKWFGSYRRTTNALPSRTTAAAAAAAAAHGGGEFNGESFVGFEYSPATGGKSGCRKENGGMHVVGNLKALMFSGMYS